MDRSNTAVRGTFFDLGGFSLGDLLTRGIVHLDVSLKLEEKIAVVNKEKNESSPIGQLLVPESIAIVVIVLGDCVVATVRMTSEATQSASNDTAVCATVTSKNCSGRLIRPRKKDTPRTSSGLESIRW